MFFAAKWILPVWVLVFKLDETSVILESDLQRQHESKEPRLTREPYAVHALDYLNTVAVP